MKKWALVDYFTEVPVSKYAYTSADTLKQAIDNFRRKRSIKNPKFLMFANFLTQYETSKWKVIEVPEPKPKVKRAAPSFKSYSQSEFDL